jgi:hypothetical protein
MDNEIAGRIESLSSEAPALFWEIERRGEETKFKVPPDELVANLHQRMAGLPPQDQPEFVDLFRAITRKAHEEGLRLEAEGLKHEGFMKLIARAQELDRRAGRPVNEDMNLKEAIPKLEAAGELSLLEREYYEAVKHELVWVPVDEDE